MTAEILRVADGQVRCGRCHTQFDALERLIEEGDSATALSGRFLQTPPPQPDSIQVDEPDAMEDITLEGRRIEISGTYRVVDDDHRGEPQIRQEVIEEWVEIDDEPENGDASAGIEVIEEDASTDETPPASDAYQAPPLRATRAPLGSRRFAEATAPNDTQHDPKYDAGDDVTDAADDLVEFEPGRRSRTALIWKILAAPLALVLIAQVVHHYRAELARHPRLGAPLMSIYEALGLHLTPDWNLHAYSVKQWGVVMDTAAPGTLKVRASITNNAPFPQPQPLLKLVLEDRWGDQVRAREFEPTEYLDPGIAADRLLAPAQQTNATISIVDPGPDAEGFRFDVCLRGKSGPVCAAEVAVR